MINKMNDFTFKHSEQPDDLYTYLTSAQVKEKFDSRGIELKTFLDNLITILNTDGANNIGITTVTDLEGNTIQTVLQNFRDKLKATTDGTSGADFIAATSIEGLTGNTVQSLLEALKQYADSLDATKIKANPIAMGSGATVQEQLAWLLSQIAVAATGSIPDGSLGETKLTTALAEKINKALSNTGVLTTLITNDKSSAVNAINEVKTDVYDIKTSTGDLSTLNTTDKSSLVNAINENTSQLSDKATKTEVGTLTSLNTTSKTNIVSAVNEVNSKTGTLSTLLTTDKTNLVNAVNELFTNANNLKSDWAGVVGSPLLATDTSAQLKSKTQTIKDGIATNLTSKGVSATGSETLTALKDKINNISTSKNVYNLKNFDVPGGQHQIIGVTKKGYTLTIRRDNSSGINYLEKYDKNKNLIKSVQLSFSPGSIITHSENYIIIEDSSIKNLKVYDIELNYLRSISISSYDTLGGMAGDNIITIYGSDTTGKATCRDINGNVLYSKNGYSTNNGLSKYVMTTCNNYILFLMGTLYLIDTNADTYYISNVIDYGVISNLI